MKVSLYFDDDLWAKFKRMVLRRTGDARTLSSEVQKLIQSSFLEESVASGFGKMALATKLIDSSQVVPVEPAVATSSGATLRGMRESRHEKGVPR